MKCENQKVSETIQVNDQNDQYWKLGPKMNNDESLGT